MSSKILLRSQILEAISSLKTSRDYSDATVEAVIALFKGLGDDKFVIELLLKEVNCQDTRFDFLLMIIAREVSAQICETESYELLKLKTVSDKKKLLLINNLRDMGKNIDYNDMQTYVSDPDAAVDIETQVFLEDARTNPEAQIDFLDFFFTVSESDRKMLLESIVADFKGDELANVLAPVILYNPNDAIVPACIEALKKCKSYLALEPLNYIVENTQDEGLKSQARRVIAELKLMGLREKQSKKELFKKSFESSSPIGYWISPIDGGDNFSLIFARRTCDKTAGRVSEVSTFFTVVNLAYGASACFGFSNLVEEEFNSIFKRFFGDSSPIELELSVGQKFIEQSIKKSKKPPYEILCWRTLTYDIDPIEGDLNAEFERELQKLKPDEIDFEKLIDSRYIQNWFFKYGQNPAIDTVINKISELNPQSIDDIDALVKDALYSFENGEFETFNERLLVQAYCANKSGDKYISNVLYSLIEPSVIRAELLLHIVQKSVYKYFIEMAKKPSGGAINIFSKKEETKNQTDPEFYIKLIESAWVR